MSRWNNLQRRVKSEAKGTLRNNMSDGVAIISVHMLVDSAGEPLAWVIQDGKRIEPSKDAKDLVDAIIGGLS
jgi:hypothetical protein